MINNDTERGIFESDYQPNGGSAWIASHWGELPKGEWVAANSSRQIASDPTFDGLLNKLVQLSIKISEVTIAYIDKDND